MASNVEARKSANTKFLWLGLIAVIVILGGVWVGLVNNETARGTITSADAAEVNDLEPLPVVGHPAPDFTLTDLNGSVLLPPNVSTRRC